MSSPSATTTDVSPAHDPLTRARWLGFGGSVLIAVGGLGAGVLPRPDPLSDAPVLRILRHGAGPGVCIALAMVGIGLLVFAWWRTRTAREVSWVTRTAALWAVPLALAPPMFSRDLYIYATQGLVLGQGFDPYDVGPSAITDGPGVDWLTSISPTWADTPAPYGPLFLFFSSRIAEAADGNLIVAVLALRALAVLGVVALALLVPRLATAYGVPAAGAQWLVIANPLLLTQLVSAGHNEALMLPLLAATLLVAVRAVGPTSRVLAVGAGAGALAGLAAAVKLSAVVALPFVVVLVAAGLPAATEWRRWLRLVQVGAVAVGAALLTLAASCLVAGVGPGFVHALSVTGGISVQWTSIPTAWGLAAGWFTDRDDAMLEAARLVGTAVAVVILVVLWWRVRKPAPTPDARPYGQRVLAACAAALVLVGVLGEAFHPWYLLWAAVPLAAVGNRWTTAYAVASGALCFLILPDGYNLARATVVPGTILVLVATASAIVYGVRRSRKELLT
ncbi:polyprenol phosphomannose-dependent alpha 1,6 mannosyltransferase MptB [Cryptosporangium minutisporangium]|uniref:polyprenol phosphomannose-dependent alpha 1,6 mannosyltransferase MptB n=1 Tax=Cryptosporangium minutisporangium TaxID=113569 RepID=UPI0031E77444